MRQSAPRVRRVRQSTPRVRIKRVVGDLLRGLFVHPVDERIELATVDTPDPSATELESGQLSRTDQGVDLSHAHVEHDRRIFQRQEPGLDARRPVTWGDLVLGHAQSVAEVSVSFWLSPFAVPSPRHTWP